MHGSSTSVILVEDNPLHAQRYRENLAHDPALRLVGEFVCARDAIAQVESLAPDVALVDLGLPDLGGLHVVRYIRERLPDTAVMVVSIFGNERTLLDAIEAGATGYLLKDSKADDFNQSIHALRAGGSPISPSLARHLLHRMRPPPDAVDAAGAEEPAPGSAVAVAGNGAVASPLSKRETSILNAISHGRAIAEIGVDLHISPLTVKTHVQNIYRKLEARSRQHAVFLAQQRGLLKP
ncbi:MAG: response regulator transcription factor [Burkholderiaceae bacterium]|nr:response regulator transcription factor [Burkholderiaceae bacterium]